MDDVVHDQQRSPTHAGAAMQDPLTAVTQSEYQDAIQTLRALTRDHELTYRLKVGALILNRFFGGSARDFSDRSHNKDTKFADFVSAHAHDIAAMKLSEAVLRRCVRVKICHDSLPPGVRDRLEFSHLLAISSLGDVNQRARLAMAAVEQRWSVAQVEQAVAQAEQGRLWDADPGTPGLQLPAPKPEPAPQPGRLVTRTVKWTREISAWHQEFARIDAQVLSPAQVQRMRDAVATVRAQMDELERRLPG